METLGFGGLVSMTIALKFENFARFVVSLDNDVRHSEKIARSFANQRKTLDGRFMHCNLFV